MAENKDILEKMFSLPVCLVFGQLLMTTQTRSPTVTCLTLTNCGVSPQHIPNTMMCVCVREKDDVFKHVFG